MSRKLDFHECEESIHSLEPLTNDETKHPARQSDPCYTYKDMGCTLRGKGKNLTRRKFDILDKIIRDTEFVLSVINRDMVPLIDEEDDSNERVIYNASLLVDDLRRLRNSCFISMGIPDGDSLQPQSGVAEKTETSPQLKSENLEFEDNDSDPALTIPTYTDPLRSAMDTGDTSLNDFFSRPLRIFQETWTIGGYAGVNINPWDLYFSNTRVKNRLCNYNLLRCNLHIKIVINGTPFHFGRMMVSYLPLTNYDKFSTTTVTTTGDLIEMSQRPHIFLNPTCCGGGEMTLPFFWHFNYLNIVEGDWAEMGTLQLQEMTPLQHANLATDPVTVSVFAWAEDVHYSILTSVEPPGLVAQNGNRTEQDEANMNGTISGTASSLAKKVSKLAMIPEITPFATASSMALNGIAGMARIMGYSRPTITATPSLMRPNPTSSMALCTVPDTVAKLTVDDKQELTIDPRISGIGPKDELSISSIASRESYLTSFNWEQASGPDAFLFNIRVNPGMWDEVGNTIHMTPMCFAATPFDYWTGKLRYRFQFVASAYHKGRIKITYDPNWVTSDEYNVNSIQIIDISEESDFVIEVGIGQERSLLRTVKPKQTLLSNMYSNVTEFGSHFPGSNGTLRVSVVNELTTPNSSATSSIACNVFVSAGDDFEVFVPNDYISQFVMKPQSMQGSKGMDSECDETEINKAKIMCMGTTNSDILNEIFIGESVQSFRTLLKRYTLHSHLSSMGAGRNVLNAVRYNFPYLRGNVANAVDITSTLAPYNYCNTILLHYLVMAFSGHRGSIRYKYILRNHTLTNTESFMSVERVGYFYSDYHNDLGPTNTFADVSQCRSFAVPTATVPDSRSQLCGSNGMQLTVASVNPVLEFEVPYYSDTRFSPGKEEDYTANTLESYEGHRIRIMCQSTNVTYVESYVAAGEDFQTYFFTGIPKIYWEPTPPAP